MVCCVIGDAQCQGEKTRCLATRNEENSCFNRYRIINTFQKVEDINGFCKLKNATPDNAKKSNNADG